MLKLALLLLFSVSLGVTGQISLKHGMGQVSAVASPGAVGTLLGAALNPWVIVGIGCYGFSMLLWLLVLSKADLSFAYPVLGLSYLGVVLASWSILGEAVSPLRWAGTLVICLGVYLVARS